MLTALAGYAIKEKGAMLQTSALVDSLVCGTLFQTVIAIDTPSICGLQRISSKGSPGGLLPYIKQSKTTVLALRTPLNQRRGTYTVRVMRSFWKSVCVDLQNKARVIDQPRKWSERVVLGTGIWRKPKGNEYLACNGSVWSTALGASLALHGEKGVSYALSVRL